MNEILKDKCDLLADNYMVIHNGFQFEEDQICKVAGLIFTSADRRADAEKLTECRKILKKQANIFSKLRSMTEIVVISKMALSGNSERYLDEVKGAYKIMREAGFEDSSYLVQASLLICDLGVSDECDKTAHKSKEIMNRLNREHPILTSAEDISSAILLGISYKDVDTVIRDFEEGYEYFTDQYKLGISKNAVQGLCELLAVTYGDMRSKCDNVAKIYNAFKTRNSDYGKDVEFAVLASLADTALSPDELADEIIEAAEYLKEKEGFEDKYQQAYTKKRLMYAALLAADVCGGDSRLINSPAIGNAISEITARRTAQAVSATINIAANLIPALLGSESDDR